MAQRNQAIRKKPEPQASRPWGWFASGAALGVCAVLALQLGGLVRLPGPPSAPAAGPDAGHSETPAASQPEFEFWTRLPQSEVVVPDVPEYESGSRAPGEAPESLYILQAGSFRNFEDADRLRAQLILMGLDAQVEKVATERGDTWHRVQTGPYDSRRTVSAARNRLAAAGIESLLLKRRAADARTP